MSKLLLRTIFLAITITVSNFAIAQNDLKAQIEFGKAETAFQDGNYQKALQHITESENLLNFYSGRVGYLKIEVLEQLANFRSLGDKHLANLNKEIAKYMDYANKNPGKVPIEKLTIVYDLEQKLKGIKADLEEQRRLELEKQRITELEEKDLDYRMGNEAFKEKKYETARNHYLIASNKGNGLAKSGLQNLQKELERIEKEKQEEESRLKREKDAEEKRQLAQKRAEEKRQQEEKIRIEKEEAQRILDAKQARFFYAEKRDGSRFLLNAGLGTGKLAGSAYEEGITSWYAGFGTEKDISSRVSYQFEFLFNKLGDWIDQYESLNLNYITLVPVGFNYYIWKNKNFGAFALESNLFASLLASSKADNTAQALIDDELINEFDFGYSLGARIHYNWFNVHLRLSNGLMEVWKKDAGMPSMKNSNLSIGIGFSF
ncbi:porin family protein [Sphingobacterium faecale]|uniref:Outer membrane protein beta-barrel domain-containing protein n=1 Tax=Sphingobacterium faecale TaxID=2803775 RepID=A0ABS1R516_9SPHI|nr:hypothetical protein [Sphingobacterium faecale]MBL1409798.1 hypothetical protein [Sphingobacterium faecale]